MADFPLEKLTFVCFQLQFFSSCNVEKFYGPQSPMTDLKTYFCFGIRQASRNPDRWNWNLPLIIALVLQNRQCVGFTLYSMDGQLQKLVKILVYYQFT